MATKSSFENDIVEEVERIGSLEPGDFGRVIDAFWSFLKYLIVSDRFFVIQLYKLGTFRPRYFSVLRAIKKEIRRLRAGNGSRERLYYYLSLRRKLIKMGFAPKTYYLKKTIKNGRSETERRRAADTLRVLQSRCQWLKETFEQGQAKERRARRDRIV